MKRLPLVTAAAVLALAAGCGAGPSPAAQPAQPSPSTSFNSGQFNATDVMFLQMMVAQYQPADEILKLAESRAADPKVKTLAAAVKVTQADENAVMQQWLRDWSQPAAADTKPELHAGHGGLPTTGKAEIEALRKTAATDFDKTFLNLLIGHQHQAVEYARMEQTAGTNPAALDLAKRVDQSRTAQIKMMLDLVA